MIARACPIDGVDLVADGHAAVAGVDGARHGRDHEDAGANPKRGEQGREVGVEIDPERVESLDSDQANQAPLYAVQWRCVSAR
jgi:hypothetical protein